MDSFSSFEGLFDDVALESAKAPRDYEKSNNSKKKKNKRRELHQSNKNNEDGYYRHARIAESETTPKSKSRYALRKNIHNSHKANLFRAWLIDHIGLETMMKGAGVLDVAGGKSELAFILQNMNGVETTCIDPRLISFEKFERRLQKHYYHRRSALSTYNTTSITAESTNVQLPRHLRIFFEDALWKDFSSRDDELLYWEEAKWRGQTVEWTSLGLTEKNNDEIDDLDKEDDATNNNNKYTKDWTWDHVRDLLADCSVVVGLHADQAVDSIVDFALAYNKPFAVVPCCIYAKEFPKRKVGGVCVRTWEQLCDYLQGKHPKIQRDVLPFGGKNVVLWWNGEN